MFGSSQSATASVAPAQPLPRSTADVIDAVTDDERRLAAELEELLSRRPQSHSNASAPEALALPAYGPSTTNRSFAWQPSNDEAPSSRADRTDESPDGDLAQGVVPSSTLAWLTKANRDKRWARARRTGAWLVTLLIGCAIVAGAAWVLTGRNPVQAALAAFAVSRVP